MLIIVATLHEKEMAHKIGKGLLNKKLIALKPHQVNKPYESWVNKEVS